MTNANKSRGRVSSLFVVIKNLFVALSILLLLHKAIDYAFSFSLALHEAYSSLPITNLDFPREVITIVYLSEQRILFGT